MKFLKIVIIVDVLFWFLPMIANADVSVSAAASLTNALTDIAKDFERKQKSSVKLSFAASSSLAKQIEQGGPADVFISADTKWINYLAEKGKIDQHSITQLAANTLVLVAPVGKGFKVDMEKGFAFAKSFSGHLCTGVVESVPAGIYAKEALSNLGWWDGIHPRVVGLEDVRAVLNMVERGECHAGVVYATDAKQSSKVEIIGNFPESTHAPIVYPAGLVTQNPDAKKFLTYLTEPAAKKILLGFGFIVTENPMSSGKLEHQKPSPPKHKGKDLTAPRQEAH